MSKDRGNPFFFVELWKKAKGGLKMSNKKDSLNLLKTISEVVLGVVIGSLLTYFFSIQLVKYESKQESIEVASIIYYDFQKSIDALNIQGIDSKLPIKNKYTNLSEQYQSLIVKLRGELPSADISKLLVYYGNLSLLEEARSKYWSSIDSEQIQNLLSSEHQDLYEMVYYSAQDVLKINELLIKVREVAKISEDK